MFYVLYQSGFYMLWLKYYLFKSYNGTIKYDRILFFVFVIGYFFICVF